MAGHGGRRAGAGRPAGAQNRATKEAGARLSELAQARAEDALAVLAEVMADKEQTGSARIAAANALLDRGYGRPGQAVQVDTNAVEQPTLDVSRLSTAALAEVVALQDEASAKTRLQR